MPPTNSKLLVVSIQAEPIHGVLNQLQKVMESSTRIRFEAADQIKNVYSILNAAATSIVLVSLETSADLLAIGEFLNSYVTPVQSGAMHVLAINNFIEPRNLQDLLTKGCAEILPSDISVVELLIRIQTSVASLNSPEKESVLSELGITQKDLRARKNGTNELKYLEEDVEPWKRGAEAFKSIQPVVEIKRAQSKELDSWVDVLLIANSGKSVVIEVPKNSDEFPLLLQEEIIIHVTAKNGDPALNFEFTGTVSGVDARPEENNTTVAIKAISGSIDKLTSLADQFKKRQVEVQDFLKAAKGS